MTYGPSTPRCNSAFNRARGKAVPWNLTDKEPCVRRKDFTSFISVLYIWRYCVQLKISIQISIKLVSGTHRFHVGCAHLPMPAWSGATVSIYIQRVADSNRRLRSSSSSQPVIRRTRLSTVGDRAFPVAPSRLWNTVCRPTSPQLQRWLFFGTASKLISFPDHFLSNCFGLVLSTVYSTGLAVLYISH